MDFFGNGYRNHFGSNSAGCRLDVGEGKVCGCESADRYVIDFMFAFIYKELAVLA